MATELEEKRVADLASQIMAPIKAHYVASPVGRQNTFEVLNALAYCYAVTLVGTGCDREASEFFESAVEKSIPEVKKMVRGLH